MVLVKHNTFGGEMSGQYFLHLFNGTVGILLHVPVVCVPTDYEPDILRSIQFLFICLQQRGKLF